MSKKDYELIAQVIRTTFTQADTKELADGVTLTTINLARAFEAANPAFNKQKFYEATRQ